jgi:hypothetical protein
MVRAWRAPRCSTAPGPGSVWVRCRLGPTWPVSQHKSSLVTYLTRSQQNDALPGRNGAISLGSDDLREIKAPVPGACDGEKLISNDAHEFKSKTGTQIVARNRAHRFVQKTYF